MSDFIDRIVRSAKLDVNLYEEVEADKTSMTQAMTIVIISSIAAGIGNAIHGGIAGLIMAVIGALIGWYVWAYITYLIGTKLLPEPNTKSDHKELLRTIGFSSSPGLIRIIGIIPGLRSIVFFIAGIWMLTAMIIAIRQALDYTSTIRAIIVCIIGWIIQMLILFPLMLLFGSN